MHRLDDFFLYHCEAPKRVLGCSALVAEFPMNDLHIVCSLSYRFCDLSVDTAAYLRRQPLSRARLGIPPTSMRIGGDMIDCVSVGQATASRPLLQVALMGSMFLDRPVYLRLEEQASLHLPCLPGEELLLKLRHG